MSAMAIWTLRFTGNEHANLTSKHAKSGAGGSRHRKAEKALLDSA
jgi:hypothetical protein